MPLTPPTLSALTAGVLVILQMALMLTVVLARRRNRQSIGDGGNLELLAAIRRHGNFAENAAIFVAGFTLLEVLGGNRTLIATMCAAFVVGRISHVVGLSMKKTLNPIRIAGVVITASVGLALGIGLIRIALSNLGM
jgi:uncharacterized membrane protein YecN with MAPEG domain